MFNWGLQHSAESRELQDTGPGLDSGGVAALGPGAVLSCQLSVLTYKMGARLGSARGETSADLLLMTSLPQRDGLAYWCPPTQLS